MCAPCESGGKLSGANFALPREHVGPFRFTRKEGQGLSTRIGNDPCEENEVCSRGVETILARTARDPHCSELRSSRCGCVGIARQMETPREADWGSSGGSGGWYVRWTVPPRVGDDSSSRYDRGWIQRMGDHPYEEDAQRSRGERAHLAMGRTPPHKANEDIPRTCCILLATHVREDSEVDLAVPRGRAVQLPSVLAKCTQ